MDCVGDFLKERLRNQNRLMLQEHQQLAEVEQMTSRDRVQTRTHFRDGEQSGDLTRPETRTQSGSVSGNGVGGSKADSRN